MQLPGGQHVMFASRSGAARIIAQTAERYAQMMVDESREAAAAATKDDRCS